MKPIQYIFRISGKASPKGSNDIKNPRTVILDDIYITNDVTKNHGIKIYKKENNQQQYFCKVYGNWVRMNQILEKLQKTTKRFSIIRQTPSYSKYG